jgi:hypothetical protein
MVCFRNISVDTLHKGDTEENNNKKKNKILKKEIESTCRLCKQHEETIDHLTRDAPFWRRTNI